MTVTKTALYGILYLGTCSLVFILVIIKIYSLINIHNNKRYITSMIITQWVCQFSN